MAVGSGKSFPLGASIQPGGVNFSVFSEHATAVQLLLFDRADDRRPAWTIELDPRRQRTYHYWHAFVPGLRAGADLRLAGRGAAAAGPRPAIRSGQSAA
jgi:isoamylase